MNILDRIKLKLKIGGNLLLTITWAILWVILCQFDIPKPFDIIKLLMAIPFIILVIIALSNIKKL